MQRKVDSVLGKVIYGRRLATAEPAFADIRYAKGLGRFTLRGRSKVNGQWQLNCIVHNLFKVHRFGAGVHMRETESSGPPRMLSIERNRNVNDPASNRRGGPAPVPHI